MVWKVRKQQTGGEQLAAGRTREEESVRGETATVWRA